MCALRTVVLAISLVTGGCATPVFQYAHDVGSREVLEKAQPYGEVRLTWRLGSAAWVNAICGGDSVKQPNVHGCALRDDRSGECTLFLVEADDFQDVQRLAVMGHELWHCLGARHG